MNQLEAILKKYGSTVIRSRNIFQPLTKLIIVLIYVLAAFIVVRILNKVIAQFFKVNNRSGKSTRAKRSKH